MIMKKLSLFLSLVWLPIVAGAQTHFMADGIRYRIVQEADESMTVGLVHVAPLENGEYEGDVVIPNAVKSGPEAYAEAYKVVGIDEKAFADCYDLESVTLPPSVEAIGALAFQNSPSLEKVVLPYGNLTEIGPASFCYAAIRSIEIPASVRVIRGQSFALCERLASVVLPEGLEQLEGSTFLNCTSLTSIHLPASLKSIGFSDFSGTGLKEISFPQGLRIIPMAVCSGCPNLTKVDIPESVREIQNGAFANCPRLEFIHLPSRLRLIGSAVFSSTGLKQIDIPEGVSMVPDYCFSDCESLTSVRLPEGLEKIGDAAFSSCPIQTIHLPSSLKTIGVSAFSFSGITQVTIPGGISSLPESCFNACKQLTSVTLSEGLESVGEEAFYECPIQTLVLPSSLKTLEEECFARTNIQELIIPYKVTILREDAFESCRDLVKVDILAPLDNLDKDIFSRCYKLKSVTVHFPIGKANPYPEDGLFRVVYD